MRLAVALLLASAIALPARAEVCAKWGAAEAFGMLDTNLVNEASGLAVSRRFPDRLYHNNDSGDGLRFYISDLKGGGARAVEIEGERPRDIEDLSLGPCGQDTCLYLADVGDNPAKRDGVKFTVVTEQEAFPDLVTPLRVISARYPDGAHNAESVAVHPNGDLYLVTKPTDSRVLNPGPAIVFRLTAAQLTDPGQVQVFEKVGEINLPKIMSRLPFPGAIATSLDIAPDGESAVLLTYVAALELRFDLAAGVPAGPWTAGKEYAIVPLDTLPQQEAIAWLPTGDGFLYDTEFARNAKSAPIKRVMCEAGD